MRLLTGFLFLLLLQASPTLAQDTLWVRQKDGQPYLLHRVRNGENLFILSRRYSVPPAALADINGVNYQEGLPVGSRFKIPVAAYNFVRNDGVVKSRPLFYKTGEEDDLHSISRLFNITQSTLQRWNNMNSPDLETGQVLQVGWIAYDKSQVAFADTTGAVMASHSTAPAAPPVKTIPVVPVKKMPDLLPVADTAVAEATALELLYEQQTQGMSLSEESGAAVFYTLKMKAAPGVYYAFHNTAARGTVLQIINPANSKVIYAKVIGTIPNLKEYHNAIVGLSSNAVGLLGATDRRMFCKVKYR